MRRTEKPDSRKWLWYAVRTPRCIPLDPRSYSSTVFDGEVIPWPNWCCKAPDGGVHVDARIGSIDVHLSKAPRGPDEVSWTCEFQVLIVSKAWLTQIEDLVDHEKVAIGKVIVDGEVLADWVTVNEPHAPRLLSSRGWSKTCPICGSIYATLWGKVFFTDPKITRRRLIIASNAIFVREDEAVARALRTPKGAYKPTPVGLKREQAAEPDGSA